ncbi:MAG: stage III sporulation AC/AD family protein [Oscillospiraceae bacterium]|nr:stage III sporulation AC/AD family protein [Oscillospiraceae bacterium]
METSFRLSAVVLTAALLTLVLKKQNPELSLVLTLCACALCAGLLLSYLEPVLSLASSLASRAELEDRLTAPLWKCLGLGLLTELTSAVCADAGQSALAKLAELGGGLLCLVVSLPLVQAVLALIEELL